MQEKILEVQKPLRKSGIDLLKIIAILLICISHANQTLRGVYDFPSFNFWNAVSIAMSPFGQFGNILFVTCSCFFLADKDRTRTEKTVNLLFDSTLISICILMIFLLSGQSLDLKTIVHQILPDLFAMNWFVPCYVVFYITAPIAIKGLRQLPQKVHFAFILFFAVAYGCLGIVGIGIIGSTLLSFFHILIIITYFKWYTPKIFESKKKNFIFFIISMLFFYVCYFGFMLLAKKISFFGRFSFTSMNSPLLLVPLIALFNCFAAMKFNSKIVSYLSGLSLFVYVIHENYLLRSITRVAYYNYVLENFGENLAIIWLILCGIFMFVVGFALAALYKETLHRLTTKLSSAAMKLINKLYDFVYAKIFERNK